MRLSTTEHAGSHEEAPGGLAANQRHARSLARRHRAAAARRARRIRRSVTGFAAALFVAAFLVVYVQLADGHDPALALAADKRSHSAGKAVTSSTPQSSTTPSSNEASSTLEESTQGEASSGTASSGEASSGGESSGEESASTSQESGQASSLSTSQS